MDPLSLLSRLATAVPPPRLHTVRYAGILAPASKLRPQIIPSSPVAAEQVGDRSEEPAKRAGSRYRPWAELLKRCFAVDVLACPRCGGRMRLVALVTEARRRCAASSAVSASRPTLLLGPRRGALRTGGAVCCDAPPARCRSRSRAMQAMKR